MEFSSLPHDESALPNGPCNVDRWAVGDGGEGGRRGGEERGGGDLPTHSLQEFSGKEMVADVSSREGEAAVLVPFLCRLDANLTVLHHLVVWE